MIKIQVINGKGRPENPHQNLLMDMRSTSGQSINPEWADFESTVTPYLCLNPNGEVAEDGNWEAKLCDAVEKTDGKIEVYDVKPLYGIRELGWKEIKVYIIQPTESGKEHPDTNVPLLAKPGEAVGEKDFQSRVLEWVLKCFGETISKDILERNDRFIEESLELVQSLGYTSDRAHALVDYVFNRPKGEPYQECGGVMVTLAALCSASELDMVANGETEYNRINTPEIIEKIRKKQAAKPTGSALPI